MKNEVMQEIEISNRRCTILPQGSVFECILYSQSLVVVSESEGCESRTFEHVINCQRGVEITMIAGKGKQFGDQVGVCDTNVTNVETCEEDHGKGRGLIWANLLDGACSCHRLIQWSKMKGQRKPEEVKEDLGKPIVKKLEEQGEIRHDLWKPFVKNSQEIIRKHLQERFPSQTGQ